MEVVVSLSQGRTAAAQCGLFTHKSVPAIFEPPCSFYTNNFTRACTSISPTHSKLRTDGKKDRQREMRDGGETSQRPRKTNESTLL